MKSKLTLSFLILSLFGCFKSNESVLLRLKYEKGDEQSFVIKVRAWCSESVHISTELAATFTVDSLVSNGTQYCISSKISGIKTDINMQDMLSNGVSEHYDSGKDFAAMNDDERALDKQYEAIMLPYYTISFNPNGEIVKPFMLYGKVTSPPFGAPLVQVPFPQQKVKVGDSWSARIDNPLFHPNSKTNFFAQNFNIIYKIEDITPDKVMIHIDLGLNADSRVDNVITNIHAEGQYIIERATGRVISARIEMPQGKCDNAVITILRKQ